MKTSVAIIGGGPCGLLSSLLLSRRGVPNVLVEKHRGPSFHPKAMGITRRSAEILRGLGLLGGIAEEDLLPGVANMTFWSTRLAGGEELGRTALEPDPEGASPCRRLHCPQPVTETVLRAAAEAETAGTLLFGTRMLSFSEAESSVKIRLESPESDRPLALEADWMIAADGDASPVRTALGIPTEGPGDLGHFLNVYFRARYGPHLRERRSLLHNVLNENGFETFVAVDGEDRWLMHHFLQEGESAGDYGPDELAGVIREMSGLPGEPVEILGVSPWAMVPKVASRWRSGRIFLTGDASARLSPAGGLGMNAGLQSAHNLAWKLAAVVQGEATPSLLESYATERLGVIGRIFSASQGHAEEVFSIVGKGLSGDWAGVREEIAASRRRGSGLGLDLGLAYPTGAFLPDETPEPNPDDPANDFEPDARPGLRAPHLPLGGGESILDRYGQGFVLLCGEGADDWETGAAGLTGRTTFPLGLSVQRCGRNLPVDGNVLCETHGITPEGAVLVRPDGIVGARWAGTETAKTRLEEAADFFRAYPVPG